MYLENLCVNNLGMCHDGIACYGPGFTLNVCFNRIVCRYVI